jgi:NADH-quinone oxidoreductase subunit K
VIPLEHYLILAAALFSLGLYGMLTRKNAINVLMSIELIFNSANLNLVAFSRFVTGDTDGQVFALFVIVIAACEAAVALAIVMSLYRIIKDVSLDEASALKG